MFDAAQDLLFQLGAHAGQRPQLLLLADPFQIVDRADAKMFEQEGDALGDRDVRVLLALVLGGDVTGVADIGKNFGDALTANSEVSLAKNSTEEPRSELGICGGFVVWAAPPNV